MKVNKKELFEVVRLLQKIIGKNSPMPILSCIRLEAKDNKLVLSATNLQQSFISEIPCDGDLDICINAKLLETLAKPELETDCLIIDAENENSVKICDGAMVTKINILESQDFPSLPNYTESWGNVFAMGDSERLAKELAYVSKAMATDNSRSYIYGIFFENGKAAATDGHRLFQSAEIFKIPGSFMIPPEAVAILKSLRGQLFLYKTEKFLKFDTAAGSFCTTLVEEKFPPVDKLISSIENAVSISVDCEAFTKALKHIRKLTPNDASKQVKFSIGEQLKLSTFDYELGEAEIIAPVIEIRNKEDVEQLLITSFNSNFILEVLEGSEKAVLRFHGSLDPLRIDTLNGRVAVIMPQRM